MTPIASHLTNMHCSKKPGSSTSETSFILHDLAKMRESCLAKTSSHCLSLPLDAVQWVLWTCMSQVSIQIPNPCSEFPQLCTMVLEISLVKTEAKQGTEYLTCSIQQNSPCSALYDQDNIQTFSCYPRQPLRYQLRSAFTSLIPFLPAWTTFPVSSVAHLCFHILQTACLH